MTKKDFATQYDFDTLRYALEIEVQYSNGNKKNYHVLNYWDTTSTLHILTQAKKPNREVHPEIGIIFPTIDEVYKSSTPQP